MSFTVQHYHMTPHVAYETPPCSYIFLLLT